MSVTMFLFLLAFIVTSLPNGSMFAIILRDERLRKKSFHWYILHFSICDSLIPVCLFLHYMFVLIYAPESSKDHVTTYVGFSLGTAETLTFCALSVDRYAVVVRRVKVDSSPLKTSIVLVSIWCVSIIKSVLELFFPPEQQWITGLVISLPLWSRFSVLLVLLFVL